VLAGGVSRRMGRDKAGILLDGATLVRRAAALLATVCPEVVVADRGRGLLLPDFPSLPDGPGAGPAAGLLGAAWALPGRPLLALACDLPRVPRALLAELAGSEGFAWAVPRRAGRLEPLCALYAPAALAALEARVRCGAFALHGLAEEDLAVRILDEPELARFGRPEEILLNVNTPDDLETLRTLGVQIVEDPTGEAS
jgi:molybdopterin-guanine dinucleotide biosynthesis protein A